MDERLKGKLLPKGAKAKVFARHDGKILHDGKFTHGESENNAVRAHHIESGLYNGCFVSVTKAEQMAVKFATRENKEKGWVYVLDTSLFEEYGVVSKEFADSQYPDEKEISIRAGDCGEIPFDVVIRKYEVDRDGKNLGAGVSPEWR